MIPLARAADYPSVSHLSPDFVDWPYLAGIMDKMPERFAPAIGSRYVERFNDEGQRSANQWIVGIGRAVTVRGATLAASDTEICRAAKEAADTVNKMLASTVGTSSESLRSMLIAHCMEHGVTEPETDSLHGLISRLTDSAWWRRQFRRTVARKIEGFARDMGMVSRHTGIYASDETVARHAEQKRRNAAALENTEAVNSEGEVFNLGELAALGVSNPSVRFAELMVRVRGMEAHAKAAGYVGLFATGTAPSRMHATKKDGRQNSIFDGTDPREAQGWIAKRWSLIRTKLQRMGVKYYGVRVAEPHHDGTPHWHMLVFIAPQLSKGRAAVGRFMAVFRRYLLRSEGKPASKKELIEQGRAQGLTVRAATQAAAAALHAGAIAQRQAERADTARRRRACDFKLIDWAKGSAAGYLVKYLAKNISGEKVGADLENDKPATETAGRVLAWASCWGIRQFQIVGGPPVGVWRELRRIKEQPEQLELFAAWHATGSKAEERKPDWSAYIQAQGGIDCKRADRPVQLWKLQEPGRLTKYGDEAGARVAGVLCKGTATATRNTVWTLRRAEKPQEKKDRAAISRAGRRVWGLGFQSRKAAPRTRVNNCTQRTKTGFAGLAENMAGWWAAGNKEKVLEIFNHMRALKNATNRS